MQQILIIELSATLRHLVVNLFSENSTEATVCKNYTQALEYLAPASKSKKTFRSVVIGWPIKTDPDADELVAILDEVQNRHLSVVVLAHDADPSIVRWVTDRNLTALVLWDNYRECVGTLESLNTNTVRAPRFEVLPRPDETKIRILFVDDSPTVRVNFRRLLRQNGYETDVASSVVEGLEMALANAYDIAIIDYFLTDGTGDQLCAQLRDHAHTARITCAIITGTYHDKVIKDSLDAGAVECMFKNEANELFLARIGAMSRMKRIMSSIEKEHKRLEGILSSVGDGVYGVNSQGLITFINPAAKEILGYERNAKLVGKSPFALFHDVDSSGNAIAETDCPLRESYGSGKQLIAKELLFRHTNAQLITVECTVFPLHIDDQLDGSVVAFRDVTERKLLEDELKWQATHDSLTKLANRYYFEEQLRNEVVRLKRSTENSALLYLDLDRFKYINDTAGHAAGDKLLVEIGYQLATRLRASDTLARIGGDEFAIILRHVTQEQAINAANLHRGVLEKFTFYYEGKSYVINVSIGMVMLGQETHSHGEALANADLACFIAKGQGRNHTHLFVGETDEKKMMDKDLGWSVRLRDAVAKDLFKLQFQPIVPLASIDVDYMQSNPGNFIKHYNEQPNARIKHNEVLLRMVDSRGELILPDAFLPTAERFNMMNDIDRWVIRNSVKILSDMQSRGATTTLSINLSAQTLEDKSLATYVKEISASYNVDPSNLLFEITENSAIANLDAANRLIQDIRALGCLFALDDFGRGFCSFSHLKFLPVDFIKIDGIFVQGVLHDKIDRAIINSVVQIAHSVGKKTIAEYVENIEVMRLLKETGVDYVQGFYISKPTENPEEDLGYSKDERYPLLFTRSA